MSSRQARLRRSQTSRFSRRNRFGASVAESTGKPVDVTRIQSLVSITTPRDGGFHGPHSTPSFVEFDHDVRRIRLSLRAVDNANSDVVDVVVVVERKRRFRLRRNANGTATNIATRRLGPTRVMEETISASTVLCLYLLGPCYTGSFQAPCIEFLSNGRRTQVRRKGDSDADLRVNVRLAKVAANASGSHIRRFEPERARLRSVHTACRNIYTTCRRSTYTTCRNIHTACRRSTYTAFRNIYTVVAVVVVVGVVGVVVAVAFVAVVAVVAVIAVVVVV